MMDCSIAGLPQVLRRFGILLLFPAAITAAQQTAVQPREFRPGILARIEDLPAGRLRTRIESLPAGARSRALDWLRNFHFTELDLKSLEVDSEGAIFYVDDFSGQPPAAEAEPVVAETAVPVDPFSAGLLFHSKPGAPNVLYLNFAGENVSGTAWNDSLGRTAIPAVAFSTDGDFSTFSDAEQAAIKRVWQRVAEDFAPFNMDVTTERPSTFGTRTAQALITRNTDANGEPNPSSTAGGVAYVNVFGSGSYATHRPAWIYYNNLANNESYIAEAASHEIGHNLGLSHDGKTDGTAYYNGHGSGYTSWGPIMGTGYGRNVSQWSRGEYYLANNTQDDLATIASKISYRSDDHSDAPATASPLVITGGTNVVSTTSESDPTPANKGVLERNTDTDVFSFTAGGGPINLIVNPWINPSGTRGGNLDILLELHDAGGTLILTNNPASQTTAQLQTTLSAGTYYLHVRNTGVGDPMNSVPTGYTPYGSIGQYFISGYIAPSTAGTPLVHLSATVNNPAWGSVNPTSGTYAADSTVQIIATPASYYRFVSWTNGAAGTNNPLTLVLNTNVTVHALFAEILTTNYPTPHWWLASQGYTSNFESAVTAMGANGLPLWQSYIAGLNPGNPNSQLRLSLSRSVIANANILNWNTTAGRVYTLFWGTNPGAFTPVPSASSLPSTIQSFTNAVNPASPSIFYRIEVRKL
jgi:hypothetical protein